MAQENGDDRLLLDDKIFMVYCNPLCASSPTYTIMDICDNIYNYICISPSYEEDILCNERHSCTSSPWKNLIKQDNKVINEQENATIDNSLASDEVILEEPTIECHKNLVFSYPNNSPNRDDIMVEINEKKVVNLP
jgi:hypothetical protein